MTTLPSPPPAFTTRKEAILSQLAIPDEDYADASPKGSVDEGIRHLIGEINALDGFVTTSSCAGRISVFLEGQRTVSREPADADERSEKLAGPGGKGGGGRWLYVSHDPVAEEGGRSWASLMGLDNSGGSHADDAMPDASSEPRFVHFKFEPMILHILTASLAHAQLMLKCGLQAGFRESGAINLVASSKEQQAMPMVAIRCMGLTLESLIGVEQDGRVVATVSEAYLITLVRISNERFRENKSRIQRFQEAVNMAYAQATGVVGPRSNGGQVWEDAAARRERKRAEGLRRRDDLRSQVSASQLEEEGGIGLSPSSDPAVGTS